jgi:hypothetical protein
MNDFEVLGVTDVELDSKGVVALKGQTTPKKLHNPAKAVCGGGERDKALAGESCDIPNNETPLIQHVGSPAKAFSFTNETLKVLFWAGLGIEYAGG